MWRISSDQDNLSYCTLSNHGVASQSIEPIRGRSEYPWLAKSAGKYESVIGCLITTYQAQW